jgi:hypothetical protein
LRRPRAGPLRTKTIRAVCRRFNDVSQQTLGTWITMKFIVAQQTYEPVTTREERLYYKQTLAPLKSWNIWLFPSAPGGRTKWQAVQVSRLLAS